MAIELWGFSLYGSFPRTCDTHICCRVFSIGAVTIFLRLMFVAAGIRTPDFPQNFPETNGIYSVEKIMFVCEIHKISKMIILFKQTIRCRAFKLQLGYFSHVFVMLLSKSNLIRCPGISGTSCNHWRNPPRGMMLNNLARLIHYINLCCSFCHFSRTWSWVPEPLEKTWSFLLSLCSRCSWGFHRSWSMTFNYS